MKDSLEAIKSFIKERGVTIRKEIYRALDIPQRTLTWRLNRLVETGQAFRYAEGYYFSDKNSLNQWLADNDKFEIERKINMNARNKIITYLETHKPATKKELIAVTKLPSNRIGQVIRDLTESGQLEKCGAANKPAQYRLTDLHSQRIKSVMECFQGENRSTAGEVSDVTGIEKMTVTQILISLNKQGELHREWEGRRKVWVYSKLSPFTFGCANNLTAFFNKALREVRVGL